MFNKAVDKTTATTVSNYTLNSAALVVNSDVASLQSDNKTVIITLNSALTNQSSNTFQVANVQDTTKNVIALSTATFTAFDNNVPVAQQVVVTGPNTAKVIFSAPINTSASSNYTLDSGAVSVSQNGTPVINGTEYSVNLIFGSNLANGAHTLNVNGAVGFNTFSVASTDIPFNFVADTTAPTASISSVKLASTSSTTVVVKFSKPVALNGATLYAIYDGVSAYGATAGTAAVTTDSTATTVSYNGTTYADTYDFTISNILPAGNLTFYLDNASSTSPIQDLWANAFVNATLTGTLAIDTAKPTVTAVTASTQSSIEVDFSEAVTGADNAQNYTLQDANGTVLTNVTGFDASGHPSNLPIYNSTTYAATLTGLTLPAGNYKLQIANVKDLAVPAANTLDTIAVAFTVADKTAPTVLNALSSSDQKTLFVYFSKAMNVSDITNAVNYRLASAALPSTGVTITAINGNTVAKIAFATAQTLINARLDVAQVRDAVGNYTTNLVNTIASIGADGVAQADIVANSVKATTAIDTITFEVDQQLSGVTAGNITINSVTAGSAGYVNTTISTGAQGAVVTVKLNPTDVAAHKWSTGLTGLSGVSSGNAIVLAASALTNANGNANAGTINIGYAANTNLAVQDKVAPAISTIVTKDGIVGSANSKIDAIQVTFTEPVLNSTVGLGSFTVAGYTITDVQPITAGATSDKFNILVTEKTYTDTNVVPTVTLVQPVKDAAGNVMAAQTTGTTATDGVAPAVSGVVNGGFYKTVSPTFTEGTATLNGVAYTSGTAIAGDAAQVLVVTDAAGNATTVNFTTDNTAPTASVTTAGSATTFVVTYSEALYDNAGVAITDGANLAAKYTPTLSGGVTITSATYNLAAKTVTFTISGTGATSGDTIVLPASTLQDAAGNATATHTYTFTTTWAQS